MLSDVFLSYSPRAATRDTTRAGGAHRGSISKNSHRPHCGYTRSTISSHTKNQTALAPTQQSFLVPPQSPHSCLRKKAQDRVITHVQALSHPGAVIFHSHRHAPDLADKNQTYPLPRGFFPPAAAAVTAKCQLSPKRESKYCDSPTSSTNVRGRWWGRLSSPARCFL